jgi:hypothetical protein
MATGGVPYSNSGNPPVKLKKKRPKAGVTPHKKNPPKAKPKLTRQPAPKPYDPFAPLDPAAIEANARARAQSQVQPEIDSLSTIARDTAGAHATRGRELLGWYGGLGNTLEKSYAQSSDALNRMIALNNAGGGDANNVLTAALRAGNQPVEQAAGMMKGVQAPTSDDAQILASAAANASNQANFTNANAMGTLQAQGDRRQLAAVGGIEAAAAENRRYDAQRKELGNQAIDVARRIPDLQNVARQDLQALEQQKAQLGEARANRLFQQYLAEKELNLKSRNETFQEYLATQQLGVSKEELGLKKSQFAHQSQIDWAQIGLNQKEIEARLASIKGKDTGEKGKLRAKQWDNGLSMLQGYMTPGEGEGPIGVEDPQQLIDKDGNPLRPYRRSYDDALRILTGKARMAQSDALRVLLASDFPSWRQRARKELARIKSGLSPSMDKLARSPSNLKKKPPVKLKKR